MHILREILKEVERAKESNPTWPTDPLHAKSILGEELGELERAILQTIYEPDKAGRDDVREEAIQVAAMCVRFLQSLDYYEYQTSGRHVQPVLAVNLQEDT